MSHHHREVGQAAGYASIMVPVDLGAGCQDRIKLAGALADRFEAHLVGVGGRDLILPIYGGATVPVDARVVELEEARVEEDLAAAETVFRRAAGTRNDLEWRRAVYQPSLFAAEQARAADLIVARRQGPKDPRQGLMGVDPGELVMEAGRPVLVVPPGLTYLGTKQVVIAWKDTREARRAIWDSLPLLRLAESVFVLTVGGAADKAAGTDVGAYLTRHGVEGVLTLTVGDDDRSEAEQLMRFAVAEGADLIVAGAYGHSRLREWLFGGVTHDLLRNADTPCLLAH